MAQLPSAAAGSAVFAVTVAVIAISCGLIMLWLTWRNERYSYVALIGWFSIITTLITLAEQIYYIIGWRDIFTADAVRKNNNLVSENPHLWIALTFGMSGLDLAFFWIMMCGYTIESLLVMFWAIELASSVYGLLGTPESKLNRSHQFVLKYGKIMAIALPFFDDLLLQIPLIKNTDIAWFIMTHSILLGSVIISIIIVCLIFVRYLDYRTKLQKILTSSKGTPRSNRNWENSTMSNPANHHGLYDRWLLPRFGIIILFLTFFEAFNIAMQINNWKTMLRQKNVSTEAPVFSAAMASWMMITSTPRCLPGIALVLIFGTTKVFRARLYRAFWPPRWQRYDENTPLETPYQSSQAGRKWYTQAPKIDLRLTSASLRWNHGDQTFAAWESRTLDTRQTDNMAPVSEFGSTTFIKSSPQSVPAPPLGSSSVASPVEQDFLRWLSTEDEEYKGVMVTFNVTAPLPTHIRFGAKRHGKDNAGEVQMS